MQIRLRCRGGAARIDHHSPGATLTGSVEELHRRGKGVRRVAADQQDRICLCDVGEREWHPPVDPESTRPGDCSRRHTESAVVVDCRATQRNSGELAELICLFVGQPASTETPHSVVAVTVPASGKSGDDPAQRLIPRRWPQRQIAPVTHQRRGQPIGMNEQIRRRPPLGAQATPV